MFKSVIYSEKVCKNAVRVEHIKESNIPLSKLIDEMQDDTRGVGEPICKFK